MLVEGHDVEKTMMSLKRMVSKEGKTSDGESSTPLEAAKDKVIVDYLFEVLLGDSNDVDTLTSVYKQSLPKGTPLVCACQNGRLEDVRVLVEGHDVEKTMMSLKKMVSKEQTDGESSTILVVSIEKHTVITKYLVNECKADVRTPLVLIMVVLLGGGP